MKLLLLIIFILSSSFADNYNNAIDKINNIRKSSGLAKLKYDSRLKKAAYKHARYIGINRDYGHTERRGRRDYTGINPSQRIVKAGYHTKAVVENISFGERTYSASIDTLMATIYHRHAFLDVKIDSIGPARAGRRTSVFVYDMSLSSLDKECRVANGARSGQFIYNICANKNVKIPKDRFYKILMAQERKSKAIIRYPYPNQTRVPSKYHKERPDAIAYLKNAGYPISIIFNPSYYRNVRVKNFTLKKLGGKYIKGKILSQKNDKYHKLDKNAFVFIPFSPLSKGVYEAHFRGVADGQRVNKIWQFRVR